MAGKKSAGILLYRFRNDELQVLLVHPGGPFFVKKDLGAWSIPKGEFSDEEDPLECAKREFQEETSHALDGDCLELHPVKLKSGKLILAWAVEGDIDADKIKSNFFEIEWPPRSGKMQRFPEVDKAGWFSVREAKEKINPGQVLLIEELEKQLK